MSEEYPYRYELHLHSCGCSACGKSESYEMVERAAELGYAGVVFNNHFYHGNTGVERSLPWTEFTAAYRDDWLIAKKRGDELGLDVIFGLEEVYLPGKEMLIFGVTPEEIAANEKLKNASPEFLADFVHSCGGFTACAHPFRNRIYIPDPMTPPNLSLFDAIEVYNQGNTDEDNLKAEEFVKGKHIQLIAGGDIHDRERLKQSGVALKQRIGNTKELASVLFSGDYRLLKSGTVVSKSPFGDEYQ